MTHKPISITDGVNVLAPQIAPEVLTILRQRGGTWAVYQNHAMDSADLGGLRFLQVGEGCTIAIAPERYPDSHLGVGWRYLLVGRVNLESGEIEASA
jgi:hypothetical protein